ncbi:glycosyltransferase family 2 protein [Flavobacterium sp. CAN_S2]|uniref:glycosyltransferase family 2 protein n=1 Tax=Flavobacterium sp. CAN_S2 TaxID=2787726 RepID=UPI0018CB5BDF
MSKVSIITINYNNLEGLKRTMDSVVHQTWQEFEYLVIDGGSTDGSATFIESQSETIDYWVSEPDKGIYNAMNKGIAKASGEYLLFLNSGDHLYDKEVLAQSIFHLTSYDLVCFDMEVLGREKSSIFSAPDAVRFSDLYFDFLPHPTTFIKKELFVTVGLYDESFAIISDWKFFILALFKYNCSYKKINETLSTFYADGISSVGNHLQERRHVMKDYFSGYLLDFDELALHRKLAQTNRFKILSELEKSILGKKAASFFLRTGLFLFSRKKLNDL